MGQPYILVETAEKAKTLQAALKDKGEVLVVPAIAAVVEAKNVDHLARGEEGFLFKPVAESHDVLKILLHKGHEGIYLAFDHSAQGEYSSWLWAGMVGQLSKGSLQCRRLHLASLDEEGLSKAMELVEPTDSGQAARFYFEECFQRCLATHLQRLLGTRSGPGGMPLSIPVLTALALLAEREQEVKEFSGTPKWHVQLSLQGSKGVFPATLKEVFGVCCDENLEGREQAKEVAGDLVGQSFRVVGRQENNLEIPAPQLYTLYDLIFDAFRYCHIPVAEAMQAATSLSAGVSVDGRRQALISSLYPVGLGTVQPLADAVKEHVVTLFGKECLRSGPLTEFGIMPVDPRIAPDDLSGLSDVARKVYDLVWRRALASQMQIGTGKEIILDLQTDKYRLQSECRVIEEPGFLQVYQYGYDALLSARVDDVLQEGEEAKVAQVVPGQQVGRTQDLYTLPSLAEDLGELGIDRQNEVVQIIGRLCAAGYVNAQENGTLQCDANLFKVVNTLNRAFPGIQGMNFVVYYAQTVDEVASGRKRFQMALKQFDQNLIMQGRPLVKVKMPTSLPKRLKKSKSIIKSDAPTIGAKKAVPVSVQKEAAFVDFGRMAEEKQAQIPEVAPEPENVQEVPAVPSLPDEGSTAGAVVAERPVSGEEDGEGSAFVEEPAEHSGEQLAFVEEDDEISLYDEEAAAEAEKLFQEAEEQLVAPTAVLAVEAAVPPFKSDLSAKKEDAHGPPGVATKPCPECGRAMILKGDRFGKYWACTGIPACRYTEGAIKEDDAEAIACPLCHQGQLGVKRTPTGKNMYVCTRSTCEFMAWSRPHPIHCPLCSSPFLVEKKVLSGKSILRCPKAGCNYSQGKDGSEPEVPVKKKKVVVRRKKGSGGGGKRKVVVRRRKT